MLCCLAEQRYRFVVPPGKGEVALARLNRFKIRVNVEMELCERAELLTVFAPGDVFVEHVKALGGGEATTFAGCSWPGHLEAHCLVSEASTEVPHFWTELDDDAFAHLRVQAGVPAWGTELDDTMIPAEVGEWFVNLSASFTKGCYVGQELIARVDSRGSNTPRKLCRVSSDEPITLGEYQDAAAKLAMVVTTTAGTQALALVNRSVGDQATVTLQGNHGPQQFGITPLNVGTKS